MDLDVNDRHVTFISVIDELHSKLKELQEGNETNEAWKSFRPCDAFMHTDGQTAMKLAIEQQDNESLKYFLKTIRLSYDNAREGVKFFRRTVTTDEKSVKAVEMLGNMYDTTWTSKNIIPLFSIFSLLLKLLNILYDEGSDIYFARKYHHLSQNIRSNSNSNVSS